MPHHRNNRLTNQAAIRIVRAANDASVGNASPLLGPITTPQDTLLPIGGAPSFPNILAAEQVIHIAEGWRYLASAMHAYTNHSEGAAIHQAYYAELRAALSLFCGSGIQINNGDNYYLDTAGRRVRFPGATHDAAWTIWNAWAKERYATQLLKQNIKLLPNIMLGDMDADLGGALSVAGILEKWGYDLLCLSRDRRARNIHSYDAYWKTRPLTAMTGAKIDFLKSIWNLMLPGTGSNLNFDEAYIKYLVTKTLLDIRVRGQWPARWYRNFLHKLSAHTGEPHRTIHNALIQAPTDLRLFDLAAAPDTEVENVLSRALFLLRIATLSTENRSRLPGGAEAPALKWLHNWLEHAGLWRRNSGISRFDMADDYRDALTKLTAGAPLPEAIWSAGAAQYSGKLSRADACLIWGVA